MGAKCNFFGGPVTPVAFQQDPGERTRADTSVSDSPNVLLPGPGMPYTTKCYAKEQQMSDASTPSVVQVDPAKPERHLFQISPLLDENRDTEIQPVYISLGLEPSAFP